jgi:hypothetical protein
MPPRRPDTEAPARQELEDIMARMRLRAAATVAALVALLVSGGAWWKY